MVNELMGGDRIVSGPIIRFRDECKLYLYYLEYRWKWISFVTELIYVRSILFLFLIKMCIVNKRFHIKYNFVQNI